MVEKERKRGITVRWTPLFRSSRPEYLPREGGAAGEKRRREYYYFFFFPLRESLQMPNNLSCLSIAWLFGWETSHVWQSNLGREASLTSFSPFLLIKKKRRYVLYCGTCAKMQQKSTTS